MIVYIFRLEAYVSTERDVVSKTNAELVSLNVANLTEVVTEVDHGVRDVELPMTGIVLVVGGGAVAVHVVAEELTCITNLPVAAYT